MKKIGRLETVASIVYKAYEVIEVNGAFYAGTDAFSYPEHRGDLREISCLLIPEEWRWVEQYEKCEPHYGDEPMNEKGKYQVIKGNKSLEKIKDILTRHETGCLALNDAERPYVIPVNHAYRDGKLYIHTGKMGKKLGLIRRDPNATYMLYGTPAPIPADVRSCHLEYESIIFYGTVEITEDAAEKEQAIFEITNQYGTPYQHGMADMIEILVFHIDHATARTGRFRPALNRPLYYFDFTGDDK